MNVFELAVGLAIGWALTPFVVAILIFTLYLCTLLVAALIVGLGALFEGKSKVKARAADKKMNR